MPRCVLVPEGSHDGWPSQPTWPFGTRQHVDGQPERWIRPWVVAPRCPPDKACTVFWKRCSGNPSALRHLSINQPASVWVWIPAPWDNSSRSLAIWHQPFVPNMVLRGFKALTYSFKLSRCACLKSMASKNVMTSEHLQLQTLQWWWIIHCGTTKSNLRRRTVYRHFSNGETFVIFILYTTCATLYPQFLEDKSEAWEILMFLIFMPWALYSLTALLSGSEQRRENTQNDNHSTLLYSSGRESTR